MQQPKALRFVVQEHRQGSAVHWDLMLQIGDCLQTWRLDPPPYKILKSFAKAVKIFDHPLKFLTYEGPVNRGQGHVQIVESGTYRLTNQTDSIIELNLAGKILNGEFALLHIKDNT